MRWNYDEWCWEETAPDTTQEEWVFHSSCTDPALSDTDTDTTETDMEKEPMF